MMMNGGAKILKKVKYQGVFEQFLKSAGKFKNVTNARIISACKSFIILSDQALNLQN